jgi:hypothetical protein
MNDLAGILLRVNSIITGNHRVKGSGKSVKATISGREIELKKLILIKGRLYGKCHRFSSISSVSTSDTYQIEGDSNVYPFT